MSIQFNKAYTHPFEIIAILKSRGLNIGDSGRSEHYIRNIGYYRLSAYLYPLLQIPKEAHRYKAGSTFQDALNLYRFDKKLRLFLFNEIEKVEIALRSALANIVAEETGNIFWMTDAAMFANADKYKRTMVLVDKELPNNDMKGHLQQLLADFPMIDIKAMGFPVNWQEEPLWKE